MVVVDKQRGMASRGAWRAWLREHYATETELWLVFFKKHTGKADLSYEEAVREVLCFGWIDGVRKRIDEDKHMIRFSPRCRNSRWSATNKKRVAQMIAEGRMTEAGLVKVEQARRNGRWAQADEQRSSPDVPEELKQALACNKVARRHFQDLAPSYRKQFVGWIADAKRSETRNKRVAEAIRLLTENKKLGMK